MKKSNLLVLLAIAMLAITVSSCGLSNMSYQEGHDAGYAIGKMFSN